MQAVYVILAGLLSMSAADRFFFYKSSVQRGFLKNAEKVKYRYYVPSGQCSATFSYMKACLLTAQSSGIKVTVKDNNPYPVIKVNEMTNEVTVTRTAVDGGCAGSARVTLKMTCYGGSLDPGTLVAPELMSPEAGVAPATQESDDSLSTNQNLQLNNQNQDTPEAENNNEESIPEE